MNVSLTSEVEKLVTQKEESNLYNSASEIQQIELDALRRDVEKGVKDSEEGRVNDGREVMAKMKDRLLQRK